MVEKGTTKRVKITVKDHPSGIDDARAIIRGVLGGNAQLRITHRSGEAVVIAWPRRVQPQRG